MKESSANPDRADETIMKNSGRTSAHPYPVRRVELPWDSPLFMAALSTVRVAVLRTKYWTRLDCSTGPGKRSAIQ